MIIWQHEIKKIINAKGEEYRLFPHRDKFDTLIIGTILPRDINITDGIGYLRRIARNRLIALVHLPLLEVITSLQFRYFESTEMHEKCWIWCTKPESVALLEFKSQINILSRFRKPLNVKLTFSLLKPEGSQLEIDLFLNGNLEPQKCIEGENNLDFTIFPGANILKFSINEKESLDHFNSENIIFGFMNFQISVPGLISATCICKSQFEYTLRKTFHRSGYENLTLGRWARHKSGALNIDGDPSDFWQLYESASRSARIQLMIASSC